MEPIGNSNDTPPETTGRWRSVQQGSFLVRPAIWWGAHFNLIAMTRLLSNHGDGLLEASREVGKEKMTANFKNALAIMAANLEELVLIRAAALAETVTWMVGRILAVRSRLRPGRLYSRRSRKPISKWHRGTSVAA